MSRRALSIFGFALAILATWAGWYHVNETLKSPSHLPITLWFPLATLLGSGVWFVPLTFLQFPLFAGLFAYGAHRWSPARALTAVFALYAVLAGLAFLIPPAP